MFCNVTMFVCNPKLFVFFIHFSTTVSSFVSPGCNVTWASNDFPFSVHSALVPSVILKKSGMLSITFAVPSISDGFLTTILYVTTMSVSCTLLATTSIWFKSSFKLCGSPFTVILSINFSTLKLNVCFL